MTLQFARRIPDKVPRQTFFLAALPSLHRTFLPERKAIDHPEAGQSYGWKTTRLRPEVAAILEALGERFKLNRKARLTVSEIVAAVLIEGLPALTKGKDFGGTLEAHLDRKPQDE